MSESNKLPVRYEVEEVMETTIGPDVARVKNVEFAHDLAAVIEDHRKVVHRNTRPGEEPDYIWGGDFVNQEFNVDTIIKKRLAGHAIRNRSDYLLHSIVESGVDGSYEYKHDAKSDVDELVEVARSTARDYDRLQIASKKESDKRQSN